MLDIYDNVAKLFAALFKSNDGQPNTEEIQESDKQPNDQPDTTDMHDLGSDKSTDQEGKRLKILIPSQILSRLSITLAQLNARNNSGKLKNQIRQLFAKKIYNNFIKTI